MRCRVCGHLGEDGLSFEKWVKSTFTDHDKLCQGDVICNECLFWFDERSEQLAQLVGKAKPQRMRNYSHFIVDGEWIPLSKGDKARMAALLTGRPFPELAVVAETGQKHIIFRAIRNPQNAEAGWVQFEEQSLFVEPAELADLLKVVESLYSTFSKAEIGAGHYAQYRIRKFGLGKWYELEQQIAPLRGGPLFKLVLFLAQKRGSNGDDTDARNGGRSARNNLAGDAVGLQEQISTDDLAAIRGPGEECGVHEPAGGIHQLTLPEATGDTMAAK